MSTGYFQNKYEKLTDMDNAQKRGRAFDYFIGLLFKQLPNVEVYIGKKSPSGEIDVYITCLDSPEWLTRLWGNSTAIENKWVNNRVETSDISTFHRKTKKFAAQCKICYFVSMSGFTSGDNLSAREEIQTASNPALVGIGRNEVEKIIGDGTPEQLIRERMMM